MVEKITSMVNAIEHPLVIGDFVTAPFYSGSVSLFKIVGFSSGKLGAGFSKRRAEYAILQRTFKTEDNKSNEKPVKRTSDVLTWVSTEQATAYLMCK